MIVLIHMLRGLPGRRMPVGFQCKVLLHGLLLDIRNASPYQVKRRFCNS